MDRITTATRAVDLFGVGKDGFKDDPPNSTQLDSSWFNGAQETLIQAIEEAGIVPDALDFNQLSEAISTWTFTGSPNIDDTLTINDGAMLTVANGGTLETDDTAIVNFKGPVTLGTDGTDTVTCNGDLSVINDMSLAATKTFTMGAGTLVDGTVDTVVKIGHLELLAGAAVPTVTNRLAGGSTGGLAWHDNEAVKLVHYTANGVVFATGDQEGVTASLTNQFVAQTSVAVIAQGNGMVRVIAEGQVQITVPGNNIDMHVQEDETANPSFTSIGVTKTDTCNKILDNDDWQEFRIERTFSAGTTANILYRLRVDPIGASARVRNVNLRVVSER